MPRRSPRSKKKGLPSGTGGEEEGQGPSHPPEFILSEPTPILDKLSTPRGPVYAKKSKPVVVGEEDKLKWIGYPNSVLNRIKKVEDLVGLDVDANPKTGVEVEGNPLPEVVEEEEDEDDGWETLSETDGEWEEQLVLLELDDVPNVQELFAVQPDEFLRDRGRRFRSRRPEPVTVKATYANIKMRFHEFHSSKPMLRIGKRHFTCKWEEPVGSSIFFRKRTDGPAMKQEHSKSGQERRPCSSLTSIMPEQVIPYDKVFGSENLMNKDMYDVVAMADKILKTELVDASNERMKSYSTRDQFLARPGTGFRVIPQGYSAADLMAGQYVLKRQRHHKRKKGGAGQGSTSQMETSEEPNLVTTSVGSTQQEAGRVSVARDEDESEAETEDAEPMDIA